VEKYRVVKMKGFEVEVYKWERYVIHITWLIISMVIISAFFFRSYVLLTSQLMVINGFLVMLIVIEIRYREYKQKRSFDYKNMDNKID
jgi:hypothetical protein